MSLQTTDQTGSNRGQDQQPPLCRDDQNVQMAGIQSSSQSTTHDCLSCQEGDEVEIDCHYQEEGSPNDCVLRAWERCRKNPGHKDFIPVCEFSSKHLPECCQDGYLEFIKAISDLTVKMTMAYTSKHRPDRDPLSSYRGTTVRRNGSGVFHSLDFSPAFSVSGECVDGWPKYQYEPGDGAGDEEENIKWMRQNTEEPTSTASGQDPSVSDADDITLQDKMNRSLYLFRFFLSKETYEIHFGKAETDEEDVSFIGKAAGEILSEECLRDLYNTQFEVPWLGQVCFKELVTWEKFIKLYNGCYAMEHGKKKIDKLSDIKKLEKLSVCDKESDGSLQNTFQNDENIATNIGNFETWYKTEFKDVQFPKKVDRCPCQECEQSGAPKKTGYLVGILTANHNMYNDEEARKTTVEFFYDKPGAETKKVYGLYRKLIYTPGDVSLLMCTTHDLELVETLKHLSFKRADTRYPLCDETYPPLAVVISHPHGNFKHITVGRWTKQRIYSPPIVKVSKQTGYEYTAATCKGSSGGPVLIFGYPTTTNNLFAMPHPHHGSTKTKGVNRSGTYMSLNADIFQ